MSVTLPPAAFRPLVMYAALSSGLTAVPVIQGKAAVVTMHMRFDFTLTSVYGKTASPGLAGDGMGNLLTFGKALDEDEVKSNAFAMEATNPVPS